MNDFIKDFQKDLLTLDDNSLRIKILNAHPYDIAQALLELEEDEKQKIYILLSKAELADILAYMEVEDTVELFEDMSIDDSAQIISEMETDDAADIMLALDDDEREKVIKSINKEVATEIAEFTKYDENIAASIMNNNYLSININATVPTAMKKLVKESSEQEMIDVLFIVNDRDELVGIIDLKKLIIARKDEYIKDIMNENFKYVEVSTSIDEAVFVLKEYNLLALPVVENKILKGIITIDDAIDYIEEEVSDDYDKLAGLSGDSSTTLKSALKSRLPWLCILLVLSFIVSTILGLFEEIIAVATVMVFFQTLILDMGGNAGTQSLATSIISISQSGFKDDKAIRKYIMKELRAGFFNGIILGACAFVITLVFMLLKDTPGNHTMISLVIGISMIAGITISNFVGSLVPMLFYRLKIDPAVASGPFITTVNDILGVIIYYSLAYFILIQGGFL